MEFFRFIATRAVRLHKLAVPALLAHLTSITCAQPAPAPAASQPLLSAPSNTIPFDQIGAVGGKQYSGDGLAVETSSDGATLRCVFQRLNGHATAQGLWLTSTKDDAKGKPFQVVARALGRASAEPLASSGRVQVDGQVARFIRPGLTEEYSVSMDGLQQDFVIAEHPPGQGAVRLELEVNGAKAEAIPGGAKLVLDDDGRPIVYNRLKAVDARGQQLPVKLEALTTNRLALVLDDAAAEYPVRIDPTFTDANWVSLGAPNGVSGGPSNAIDGVYAIAVDSAGNVYVGGNFTAAGGSAANSIAEWNGNSWLALGSGMSGGVSALAVLGSTLYAGGGFTSAGGSQGIGVAQWNGSSWSPVGSGVNGTVSILAVSGSNLYIGGNFTEAGGVPANGIAIWNGSSWSPLGPGAPAGGLLAVSGTNVYAETGNSGWPNGTGPPTIIVSQWSGTSWSPLGSGLSADYDAPEIYAAAASGSTLYVGGHIYTAGGVSVGAIAEWNGTNWSALGSPPYEPDALAISGSNLYAGGHDFVSQWNGTNWSALGSGLATDAFDTTVVVNALAVSGSNLYVGGNFPFAVNNNSESSFSVNNIAQWNGSSWSALGTGLAGGGGSYSFQSLPSVNALAVLGSTLYAGGTFTAAAGSQATGIAQWNGSSWSPLGSGLDGVYGAEVLALAVSGSNLYVGGDFTNAGGVAANCVAQWNGSSWSALGSGLSNGVSALAVSGGTLYAGGSLGHEGGPPSATLAQWNGSAWSDLSSEINGFEVAALAVSGGTLYVGGSFASAGGVSATNIAEWNGSTWSALGSGLPYGYDGVVPLPIVSAMAVSGSTLYAGGLFTNAGGIAVNCIAQWNVNSWSPLGSGINGSVSALVVSGNTLYAGGDFTNAGGVAANNIAQWDGSNWSALGSGLAGSYVYTPPVSALAVSGSALYAGGGFTTAGTNISPYVAEALLAPPTIPACVEPPPGIVAWWLGQNNALDAIGGNNGVSVDGVGFTKALVGEGFALNGGTGYVQLPENLYPMPNAQPFSIELWFETAAGGVILAQQSGAPLGDTSGGWVPEMYVGTDGNLYVQLFWDGTFDQISTSTPVNDGTFHHLAVTYDGTNESVYLDGAPIGAKPLAYSSYTSNFFCQFGTGYTAGWLAGNGGWYSFNGIIDQPSLYNTALTAAQVQLIYQAGSAGKCMNQPPVILLQPTNEAVMAGGTAIFPANAASPSPCTYQWQLNGTNLPNLAISTGPTLVLPNLSGTNLGQYDVVVSNPYGTVTSSVVTLVVLLAPSIVTEPQYTAVALGSNATLSVAAMGTAPLEYQWYFAGGPLQGQTNTTLLLNSAAYTSAGSYTVVVTNLYGVITSSVANVSVGVPPSISAQPVSQTNMFGSAASFSVTILGPGPLTYQWQFNGTNIPKDIITTVAGDGIQGYAGDGGPATNAELSYPTGLTVDASGDLFIADYTHSVIRKVGTNGIITTVAGNGYVNTNTGVGGYAGDGGPAMQAELNYPFGVAVDISGNLFIADTFNQRIRKVGTNGIISTVAGTGAFGYSGDGGAATQAELEYPRGVAVDAFGNLFIADSGNSCVREVGTNGIITTVAGGGSLDYPTGVALDPAGNLFIADEQNQRIRQMGTNGIITTVAGTGTAGYSGDGGAATLAEFEYPIGLAVDASDKLFIADYANERIREVGTNGIITTVAGNGTQGYPGDGGPATNAELFYPAGVALDPSGNLFIADSSNNRIRKLVFPGPTLVLSNLTSANVGNYDVVVSSPYGSVTSSVVALVVAPNQLNAVSIGGQGVQLQFQGLPGGSYVLLSATNLTPPVIWYPVITNVADTNGNWTFAVTNLLSNTARFYKMSATGQ